MREYSSFSTIIFRFSHCFSPVGVCKWGGGGWMRARAQIHENRVHPHGARRPQAQPPARKLGREAALAIKTGLMRQAQPSAEERWANINRIAETHGPHAWATHGHARHILPWPTRNVLVARRHDFNIHICVPHAAYAQNDLPVPDSRASSHRTSSYAAMRASPTRPCAASFDVASACLGGSHSLKSVSTLRYGTCRDLHG